MKIHVATSNEHKVQEIRPLLKEWQLEVAPKTWSVIEDGASLKENALIKAMSLYKQCNEITIADDSGLFVEALDNRPGIYTARYGSTVFKRDLTATERNKFLLKNLENITNRKASFRCSIALVINEEEYYLFEERVDGTIANEFKGLKGFGYDPIFFVTEKNKMMAELDTDMKNKISHRGKAIAALKCKLIELGLK